MKVTTTYPIVILANYLWIGFVCAISFMEAWLKFQAPGIDVPLGLGIGRLVFGALNKVELVLAISLLICLLLTKPRQFHLSYVLYLVALFVLLLQTFYLLPVLDQRAEMHIKGLEVPPSNMHFIYIVLEVIKVASLFVFGANLFNHLKS